MTDPHEGKGGSYVRDPQTGERKLVERTDPAPPAAADKPETKAAKAAEKGK